MAGKQVVLGAYPNVVQAELVKDRLDAEGIPAFVADEAIGHTYAGLEAAIGGIRVLVREEDLEEAQDVLANLSHPLGTGAALSEEELAVLAAESPDTESASEVEPEPAAGTASSPEESRRTAAILFGVALLLVVGLVVLLTRGK